MRGIYLLPYRARYLSTAAREADIAGSFDR
jgi:hypothetical protein